MEGSTKHSPRKNKLWKSCVLRFCCAYLCCGWKFNTALNVESSSYNTGSTTWFSNFGTASANTAESWMRPDALCLLTHNMLKAALLSRKQQISYNFSTCRSSVSNTEGLILIIMQRSCDSWSSNRCLFPVVGLDQGQYLFTPEANRIWILLEAHRDHLKKWVLGCLLHTRVHLSVFTPAWNVWTNRGNKLWFI